MKTPEYIKPILSDITVENNYMIKGTLLPEGKRKFYIFSYGKVERDGCSLYLVPDAEDGQTYIQVSIQPIDSDKMYCVFDGKTQGYENLFCQQHENINTPFNMIELDGGTIFTGTISLGYGVDYESERGDFDIDEEGMIKVYNRANKISWEQVKEEGFDWINIVFENENGDTIEVDFELA